MIKFPTINIDKILPFRRREPYVIGIDIGSSTLKVVGMRLAGTPSLLFYSIADLPEGADDPRISEMIRKVLADRNFPSKNAALSFSDETVVFRRTEIPYMPQSEMMEALKWKAKEAVPFDMQSVCISFNILNEYQKDDGSKAMDVLFAAISREAVDRKAAIVKTAGLAAGRVNLAPFGIENLIGIDPRLEASKNFLIVDFGHLRTEMSVLVNKRLEFVRSIPMGSRHISAAIEGEPLASGAGDVVLSGEDVEKIKRDIGIAYDDITLENGVSSKQIASLVRPVLERFSEEVKRSIEYYTHEFNFGGSFDIYLTGGGSRLKNLDRYLSEELKTEVKKLTLPPSIEASGAGVRPDDELQLAALVGIAAWDRRREVNFLPREYRTEHVEFIEKISLRVVTIAISVLLAVSFLFTKLAILDYSRRIARMPVQQNAIRQVKDLQERVREREQLFVKLRQTEVPVEHIMRELSNLIPQDAVLDDLKIGGQGKALDMKGSFYGPRSAAQGEVTKFMEALERSKYFKDAQLSYIQASKEGAEEQIVFGITCSLE